MDISSLPHTIFCCSEWHWRYSLSFVMEETIAEALAPILMHDTRRRVGVVAACGFVFFLERRTSHGHLNGSATNRMRAVFTCAWSCVSWAEGMLHHRSEDVWSSQCGWFPLQSLALSPCNIFILLFCCRAKTSFFLKLYQLETFTQLACTETFIDPQYPANPVQNSNHFTPLSG